ncbi:TRAP-type C4-dicarboxylate transport system permease small subunit [Saonia flava]|uniref:TRAP-type C4-dicarboxylate transport system permease small subunit n=1 Tax=Saonia flava TaxID=523696 RepID=A0A846R4T4_9FLAO|nr:TRAP transporter small permease [Saonia flava]NJB71809.1 TRAP-type C4-dicarboxylate transport system permease small subunit [Saonia flava]
MRNRIDLVLGKVLAVIMGIMVLNVLWQVASRYIVGEPSSFTDELARYLMIWVGVLGAAYVSGKQMHVAIDVLQTRSGKKTQRRMRSMVYVLIILFALFAMVIGGSRLVYISYLLGQKSPALQIPLAFVYMVIPLSGLLIIYYKFNDFIKNLNG